MGREVRRVPRDWEHPKDQKGNFIPMYERFPYDEATVAEGLREGWLNGLPPHYGIPVMPQWKKRQRTHWQMYENTTEGTPVSPVMGTAEDLARWLADNGISAFGDLTATYEDWLAAITSGLGLSLVIDKGKMTPG